MNVARGLKLLPEDSLAELEGKQMGQWTTGETVKKLLPVLDDLERAFPL